MNIFIHYLDKELLDIYAQGFNNQDVIDKVIMSIKIAILLLQDDNEHVYIPASNYFESRLGQKTLEYFRDLVDSDYIELVSSSSSFGAFLKKKQKIYESFYGSTSNQEKASEILEKGVPASWKQRQKNATDDIINGWNQSIDDPFWEGLYRMSIYNSIDSFQNAIAQVPDSLENQAFVVNHVLPHLELAPGKKEQAMININIFITKQYIDSFLKEFNAVCFKDVFLVTQQANIVLPDGIDHISYSALTKKLRGVKYKDGHSLYSFIANASIDDLILLKEDENIQDIFWM